MVEIAAERVVRTQAVETGRHLVRLHAVTPTRFALFRELLLQLGNVGPEAHHLALDQHVEAIAVA
ncbi:hypothetical protein D9M71_433370 [compost metagenome]